MKLYNKLMERQIRIESEQVNRYMYKHGGNVVDQQKFDSEISRRAKFNVILLGIFTLIVLYVIASSIIKYLK